MAIRKEIDELNETLKRPPVAAQPKPVYEPAPTLSVPAAAPPVRAHMKAKEESEEGEIAG